MKRKPQKNFKQILEKHFPGAETIFRESCVSTQSEIREEMKKYPGRAVLLVADEQTGGVGRFGRKFFSPRGGLWFSLFVPASLGIFEADSALEAARILRSALNARYGLKLRIKKPNDIVSPDGGKLAGIIVTKIFSGRKLLGGIIGTGININNETDFDAVNAVSLSQLTGNTLKRDEVLGICLQSIADIL